MTTISLLLIATTIASALIAGLFYGYSCSVNPGLARLSDEGYLLAMQSINRAILNPLFFISFMGSLLLLPLSTFLTYTQPVSSRFLLLLAATLVYVVCVFGITMFCNVPLNDMLDKSNLKPASAEELTALRTKFENTWNKWHNIRTIASIVTFILVLFSLKGTDT
ncbi:hypothetical protein D3C86_1719890 [compost metagenome]